MKVIELLGVDELTACRAKGTQKIKDFLGSIPAGLSDEEKFRQLHLYFLHVAEKTEHFAENFDHEEFKRRGHESQDISYIKLLAKGNAEGVQMLDDLSDAMVLLASDNDLKKIFGVCAKKIGGYTHRLYEADNIIAFPQAAVKQIEPFPSYDLVVGK